MILPWTSDLPKYLLRALLCVLIVLSCQRNSMSQGLHNGTTMHINGTMVHVDGDVINEGLLTNNGVLSFTRDWESSGKYQGAGALEAVGNAPQKIAHSEQKVHTLVINGWGTKYLKGAMTISAALKLSRGIVVITSKDQLSLEEDAIVDGGSAESYLDGALTVEGTGYKFFPIGKNGTYAPIEFLDVKGESARYSMEVFENAPTISVENAIIKNGLYWQRSDIANTFGGSAIAIDFEPSYFHETNNIILLTGTSWEDPFITVTDLEHSTEANKISTKTLLSTPLIMLGEITDRWTDADFYFSTALSPNAARSENQRVQIFGDRLSSDQFHLQVFNRWGATVYETRSLESMTNIGWDGRALKGAELLSGVYPYKLAAIDKTGRKFEKNGVITIIH